MSVQTQTPVAKRGAPSQAKGHQVLPKKSSRGQKQYLSWVLPLSFVFMLLAFVPTYYFCKMETAGMILFPCYLACLSWALLPNFSKKTKAGERGGKRKGKAKKGAHLEGDETEKDEWQCVIGMLLSLPFLYGSMGMRTANEFLFIELGGAALWTKMLLIPMPFRHFRHYVAIVVLDCLLFMLTAVVLMKPSVPDVVRLTLYCVNEACVAWGVRRMMGDALRKAIRESEIRKATEETMKRFISYIMHEMRNPLSGARLLVSEFHDTVKIPQQQGAQKNGGSGVSQDHSVTLNSVQIGGGSLVCCCKAVLSQDERMKLLQLTEMLESQLGKMAAVCNDVLQLERLERGAFEFEFRAVDLREWAEGVGARGAAAFATRRSLGGEGDGSGSFSFEGSSRCPEFMWTFEESEKSRGMLEETPQGVADFVRLEQVVDNFLSNSRKFTGVGGSVCLTFGIRKLTSSEEASLKSFVLANSTQTQIATAEEEEDQEEEKEGGGGGAIHDQWCRRVRPFFSGQYTQRSSTAAAACTVTHSRSSASGLQPSLNTEERSISSQAGGETQGAHKSPPRAPAHRWAALRISVKDTGAGLREDDLPKLFKPYSQIRAGELQNGGGTGLGLSICKSFVEVHGGGRIFAESEGPGKGATFSCELFLPLVSPPAPAPAPVAPNDPPKLEGLAAERSKTQEGQTPPTASTKVFKSDDSDQEEEEGSAQGFSPMSSKSPESAPVATLRNALRLSKRRSLSLDRQAGGKEKEKASLNILLVDDDRFVLFATCAVVRRLGHNVETAENGSVAVEKIRGRLLDQQKRGFDLIILDNNMPGMSGPETAQKITALFQGSDSSFESSEGNTPDVPLSHKPLLIGCTGETSEATGDAFAAAGVSHVLHKPLRKEDLRKVLQSAHPN